MSNATAGVKRDAFGTLFFLADWSRDMRGPHAASITTAGLASAAEQRGWARVELPDAPVTPFMLLDSAVNPARAHPRSGAEQTVRTVLPQWMFTLAGDVLMRQRAVAFRRRALADIVDERPVRFVWQRHELFHDVGLRIAERVQAPAVISVHALKVREARAWGRGRPGWSLFTERRGEREILRRADLVTCVSSELGDAVTDLGIDRKRVMVLPNGVDTTLFRPGEPDPSLLQRFDLANRTVIGWTGSFKSFHNLEQLIGAMALLRSEGRDVVLLLVGDGPGRAATELRSQQLGLDARFTGGVPYRSMADHVRLMDICVVPAAASEDFHYSPTKLREYLACGRPTVVAARGEMARQYQSHEDVIKVTPGSPTDMADALREIMDNAALRAQLSDAARQRAVTSETWLQRYDALVERLDDLQREDTASTAGRSP